MGQENANMEEVGTVMYLRDHKLALYNLRVCTHTLAVHVDDVIDDLLFFRTMVSHIV